MLNRATADLVGTWEGKPIQVLHLTGDRDYPEFETLSSPGAVEWRRLPFEQDMALFFGAADLVVARAGGAVAEITATGTPSILVPGGFGSSGHQPANAAYLEEAGAAVVLAEDEVGRLGAVVSGLLVDDIRLREMAAAAEAIARPEAASVIARAMIEVAG